MWFDYLHRHPQNTLEVSGITAVRELCHTGQGCSMTGLLQLCITSVGLGCLVQPCEASLSDGCVKCL